MGREIRAHGRDRDISVEIDGDISAGLRGHTLGAALDPEEAAPSSIAKGRSVDLIARADELLGQSRIA